ncbi:MAG: hypothetical protein IKT12_07315, partial [Thermoguttaceae bacterium]|nr:hypothetical protein [Thermoguttaceae bacterium]
MWKVVGIPAVPFHFFRAAERRKKNRTFRHETLPHFKSQEVIVNSLPGGDFSPPFWRVGGGLLFPVLRYNGRSAFAPFAAPFSARSAADRYRGKTNESAGKK